MREELIKVIYKKSNKLNRERKAMLVGCGCCSKNNVKKLIKEAEEEIPLEDEIKRKYGILTSKQERSKFFDEPYIPKININTSKDRIDILESEKIEKLEFDEIKLENLGTCSNISQSKNVFQHTDKRLIEEKDFGIFDQFEESKDLKKINKEINRSRENYVTDKQIKIEDKIFQSGIIDLFNMCHLTYRFYRFFG